MHLSPHAVVGVEKFVGGVPVVNAAAFPGQDAFHQGLFIVLLLGPHFGQLGGFGHFHHRGQGARPHGDYRGGRRGIHHFGDAQNYLHRLPPVPDGHLQILQAPGNRADDETEAGGVGVIAGTAGGAGAGLKKFRPGPLVRPGAEGGGQNPVGHPRSPFREGPVVGPAEPIGGPVRLPKENPGGFAVDVVLQAKGFENAPRVGQEQSSQRSHQGGTVVEVVDFHELPEVVVHFGGLPQGDFQIFHRRREKTGGQIGVPQAAQGLGHGSHRPGMVVVVDEHFGMHGIFGKNVLFAPQQRGGKPLEPAGGGQPLQGGQGGQTHPSRQTGRQAGPPSVVVGVRRPVLKGGYRPRRGRGGHPLQQPVGQRPRGGSQQPGQNRRGQGLRQQIEEAALVGLVGGPGGVGQPTGHRLLVQMLRHRLPLMGGKG